MQRTIAVCFAYTGTDFVGSQWQSSGRSVQGELEAAWKQLTQEDQRWIFAGRTDAGVHARAQVAHVQTTTHHTLDTIVRALNVHTGSDLSVHEAWEVPASFHARFCARNRSYRYLLYVSPTPVALLQHHVTYVQHPLNQHAMHDALSLLVGEHDFAAFAGAGQAGSTVRTCRVATLETEMVLGFQCLAVVLQANAFLRHMVRNIIGTLLEVGQGRMSVADVAAILASRDRRNAGPTAKPYGLYLESIAYDQAVVPLATSTRWDQQTFWRTYQEETTCGGKP